MKTKIRLPIPSDAKILVEVKSEVNPKTVLAETDSEKREKMINLAYLLHVKPNEIAKYLMVRVGQEMTAGQMIAQKRSILSSVCVKSPSTGSIREIDLKTGMVTFIETVTFDARKITLPVFGKVMKIDKDSLEIEFEGKVLEGVKGEGEAILGKLLFFPQEKIGLFDVKGDIEKGIIYCQDTTPEVVIKLEVLGAKGLICKKVMKEISFPWLQIEEETEKKLKEADGKLVWLRPKEKEIVILEN